MDRYQQVSREVIAIMREFSPLVESISIDEAFMDISGTESLYGPPAALALALKTRIHNRLRLTCSIGVAPNRFLAKIASDCKKPDGLTMIFPDEVPGFIERLPIDKVPGVGPKTQVQLAALGIRYLGDIRRFSEPALKASLGSYGNRLHELALGRDPTPVSPDSSAKSVSSECTLEEDSCDKEALSRCLLQQAEEVAAGLRREGVKARTVVLKIKYADFKLFTRRMTFTRPTQSSKELYREAIRLLEEVRLTQKLRLIGMSATGFVPADTPRQQELFPENEKPRVSWEKVDRTVANIKSKFGDRMIRRANLRED